MLKVTEQIEHQILTMTANSEQHKPNNKWFVGVRHSIFDRLHYAMYTQDFICRNFNSAIHSCVKSKMVAGVDLDMFVLKVLIKRGQLCLLVNITILGIEKQDFC